MDQFDVCIVGAGAVGLAIARQLLCNGGDSKHLKLVLLEQNSKYGQGISSRNSEVIHAGIYYPPGSLKAKLCVRGRHLLYEYCSRYKVPCKQTGKLIIAQEVEQTALLALRNNAVASGVDDLEWVDKARLHKLESAVHAEHALYCPHSGIIDGHQFMQTMLFEAESAGLMYVPRTSVIKIKQADLGFMVTSTSQQQPEESFQFRSTVVINSCGLDAQNLAMHIDGLAVELIPPIFPCKGSYFEYRGKSPFRHLVYPLPESGIRSLGIHGTLDLAGQLRFGPDAEFVDELDYTVDPGARDKFAEAIRNYFPTLEKERLVPAYSGIRPKLSGPGQGFADFMIQDESEHGMQGLLQLFGIESPGLTASLALGEMIQSRVVKLLA
ncbi:MAG: NAD(P)/FAD-dependent oxidoreductase [Pseudohongiellaceae bacterium]